MAKRQTETRQARRDRQKAAREAKREAEAHSMRRRRVYARAAAAVGVLTLTLAAVSQWVFDNRQLVGATLLIGGVLFLWLALSTLGSSVSPRDRGRAGSINFGKRD